MKLFRSVVSTTQILYQTSSSLFQKYPLDRRTTNFFQQYSHVSNIPFTIMEAVNSANTKGNEETNDNNSKPSHLGKPELSKKLSSVILRYESGGERFQFSITINTRRFNFDRLVTESTAAFLERVKANISKKIKNFEPETKVSLIIGSTEFGIEHMAAFPIATIFESNLISKLRLGDEETQIDINPPEVISIKFLKQFLAGFPILPLKIEGSFNFDLNSSEFLWETCPAPVDEFDTGVKGAKKPKIRKPSKEIWTCRFPKSLVFTPEKADINSYVRLTCIPSNGTITGIPLTVELPQKVTSPPVENFFFRERVAVMKPVGDSRTDFRILSYNALSELLTTPEWFTASPKVALDIDYRLPLLNAEIKAYQADLLCLQEIDQKHFDRNFTSFLSIQCGLRGIFSRKTGDSVEGLATFYNPSKFSLLTSESVIVRDEMKQEPFYSSLATVPGLLMRLEDRNTILQVSVLQHVMSSTHIFIVANTHLYFKPDADHIRLLQTMTCLRYLENKLNFYKTQNPDNIVSLIFCGDFNCTPPFGSYRLATQGKVTQSDEDWVSHESEKVSGIDFEHNLRLETAFPEEELTTVVINFEGCIDYIFYQPEFLRLVTRYPPTNKTTMAQLIGVEENRVSLPNFQAPSDHLPIIADFSIALN